MRKTYYADYVHHALRHFIAHREDKLCKTDVDKRNFDSCQKVYAKLPEKDKAVITDIWGVYGVPLDRLVESYCKEHNYPLSKIWKILYDVDMEIAKNRGLI